MSLSCFEIISPWKRGWPFKHESLSLKDALCQVWLKWAQWFLRRWKCEKFTTRRQRMTTTTTTTTTRTDKRSIRKTLLSLRLRWAKNKFSLQRKVTLESVMQKHFFGNILSKTIQKRWENAQKRSEQCWQKLCRNRLNLNTMYVLQTLTGYNVEENQCNNSRFFFPSL